MRIPLLLCAGLLTACSSTQQGAPPPSTTTTGAPTISPVGPPATAPASSTSPSKKVPPLRLAKVATLTQPIALVAHGYALYVAEKIGRVRAIRNGRVLSGNALDIRGSVSNGGEQGLLGIAFHPDGARLYANYTDRSGATMIVEYPFAGGRANAAKARTLLRVEQPYANHNGGHIVFGPDGFLYIFLGDGGSAGDPQNHAQRLNTLLGKVLRIDPRASVGRAYTIPRSNPFVGRSGARGEIWAYGLRNPWRASFDRATGDMWIADVGQNAYEEIDFQRASSKGGANYGWNRLEGTHTYRGPAPRGAIAPVYQYSQSDGGCAAVGGYVYRGKAIPSLTGRYLFSDYCGARLKALRKKGSSYVADTLLDIDGSPSAFGEDRNGEIYVLTLEGTVSRLVVR